MQSTFNSAILSGLTLGAFAACSITAQSLAGPVWELDYTDDAGQLAGTAQVITSSLSPIINIYGRLSNGFVNNDLVDMYQIAITTQTLVSISTAGGTGGGSASFDSQLFIFKRKGGNGNNVRAVALRANNDAGPNNHGSRIGSETDPNSEYTLLSPGFYYLAIAGVGTTAVDGAGHAIWPDLGTPGLTVSGNEVFMEDWAGSGQVGEYNIRLTAVGGGAVPSPGAIALLGLTGLVKRRRR